MLNSSSFLFLCFFFFNDTATTEIYTLSLHDALPICPYAHAGVQAIRTDRAAAHDGVVGTLTGEEVARLSRPIRGDSAWPGWKGTDFPVLTWSRVHFVGQAVAVVAAIDRYVAEDAAELVEVDYRPLPVVVDLETAAEPGGPLVHETWGDNLFLDRQGTFG